MTKKHVAKWCRSFQLGRQDVVHCNMARSGQPSSSTTEINTAREKEMIQNDRRVTTWNLVRAATAMEACNIAFLMCYDISRCVPDGFVPCALSEEQKGTRRCAVSHFFSVTILTASTSSITSLKRNSKAQVTKLDFTISSPQAKNQVWSRNTLDHQRERNLRLHPLLVKLWQPYYEIHAVLWLITSSVPRHMCVFRFRTRVKTRLFSRW